MKLLRKRGRMILFTLLTVLVVVLLLPQHLKMPVEGAGKESYHQQSFWFYPWGKSGTHKGVDIFAEEGTAVRSSVPGIVVSTAVLPRGGNTVIVLGPKWRFHYYAHLKEIKTKRFRLVNHDDIIGTVGTTGNAKGKPSHLHYSIFTGIPYVWRIDRSHQGWKKMFFLNPIPYLNKKG